MNFTFSTVTSTSTSLTWENIDCIQHNGVLTGYNIKYYGLKDGALATIIVGSSNTTSYTVYGLMPFFEYWFHIAGVNINGTGPYTTFIGSIIRIWWVQLISVIYNVI